MSFDPDAHQTQDILQTDGLKQKRFRLPINRSVLTAIFAFLVLIGWLMSGVMSDNAAPVVPAKALVETSNVTSRFKVVVETLAAETHTNNIRLQARTEADKVVTVAAETNGIIAELPVEKGAFVQKGQVVCAIDVGARKAQLDQARANRDAR